MYKQDHISYKNTCVNGLILSWLRITLFVGAASLLHTSVSAQVVISFSQGDYSDNATWIGPAPNEANDSVLILHEIALDLNLGIEQLFIVNSTLTDVSGNNINVDQAGVFDVDGNVNILGNLEAQHSGHVIIRTGDTLEVNDAGFKNNSLLTIEAGGVLIVNGNMEVQNNVILDIDGEIIVLGDLTLKNNSSVQGDGSISVVGKTVINNNAVIFGSTEECPADCLYSNGCLLTATPTEWVGTFSSNWFIPGNWTAGIPDSGTIVYIKATATNMPSINNVNAECFDLYIESGASLEVLSGFQIDVYGDWNNLGSYIHNSTSVNLIGKCSNSQISCNANQEFYDLQVNKPQGVRIASGSVSIRNSLEIVDGAFNTLDSLTLLSDAAGTARIKELTTGAIVGKISMQRYIDAGATNWRFISSAVNGIDLEQLDDDFITSGITGSDFPLFDLTGPTGALWPSIFTYDETVGLTYADGYVAPPTMNYLVGQGEGLWVWCGDNLAGTSAFTIDMFEVPNQGDISLPVSYSIGSGLPIDDGWNMVGNPYPCPIDWNSANWTKTNIQDAVYIWNPDLAQFASYVGGVGVNGGSNIIASSQAFMVHAAGAPTLTIRESCKSDMKANFIKANIPTDVIRLKLYNSNSSDETVFRFFEGASNHFDDQLDALKPSAENLDRNISLKSRINNDYYSINSLHPDSLISIPLYVEVESVGSYSLKATDLAGASNLNCVILEDLANGSKTNLHNDSVYDFNVGFLDPERRFLLHFHPTLNLEVVNETCYGAGDAEIILLGGGSDYNYSIKDDASIPIALGSLDSSYVAIIDSLNHGFYSLSITDASGLCSPYSTSVIIEEQLQLTTDIDLTDASCENCCDGMVQLIAYGGQPSYDIQFNGKPTGHIADELCPGIHSFVVTDDNGCTAIGSIIIKSVKQEDERHSPQVKLDADDFLLTMEFDKEITGTLRIRDITGKLIAIKELNEDTMTQLNLNTAASNYYIYSIEQVNDESLVGKFFLE